ncbi:MAG: hypothetical protein LBT42_08215 [Tannerella sp.]|jgi:hypothetical protein|nr:hypothetical protein [Tannerella sp.]
MNKKIIASVIALMFFGSAKSMNTGDNCLIINQYSNVSYTWSGSCEGSYANGYGTVTWADGRKYVGIVHDGQITGNGKEYKGNLLLYDGDFHNGKWDGYGTSYQDDGTKIKRKGLFSKGVFANEKEVQTLCNEHANAMVKNFFEGGDKIKYSIYSYSINFEKTKMEMVYDLEFYKNNNFYTCRIKTGKPSSDTEILSGNTKVKEWQKIKNPSGETIKGVFEWIGNNSDEIITAIRILDWLFN